MTRDAIHACDQSNARRTWPLAVVFLTFVFSIAGDAFGDIGAHLIGFDYARQERWPVLAYTLFVAFGFTIFITLAWVRLFERRALSAVGLALPVWRRFIRGFAVGLVMAGMVAAAITLIGGYHIEAPGVVSGVVGPENVAPLLLLLLGFVVQASSEEIAFRGWLQEALVARLGVHPGAMVAALLFALIHAFNISPAPELALGVFNIFLFGMFLGYYAIGEGSLWGVCGWHAAWNWLLGPGLGLEVSGAKLNVPSLFFDLSYVSDSAWWLSGGRFGPEASLLTTVALGAATVLAMRSTCNLKRQAKR